VATGLRSQHPAARADGLRQRLLAQTLAKIDVPFTIADATTLTGPATSRGRPKHHPEPAAGANVERARTTSSTSTRSTRSRASPEPSITATCPARRQQALLKIIGHDRERSAQGGRKHPQQEFIRSTTNILFICGGAFHGIGT
jgi:ATP-dependent Clp protease ATP-binding subunit ClpX